MSNRWERGESPPYPSSRLTTGGVKIAASTTPTAQQGDLQVSVAGQLFGVMNPVFRGNAGETEEGFTNPSGQAFSRTGFAPLFGKLSDTWGAGDGSTTFNIPNLNGGPQFESVNSPGVPNPVGTVSSGNFTPHTHSLRITTGVFDHSQLADSPDSPLPGTPEVLTATNNAVVRGSNPISFSNNNRSAGRSIGTLMATEDNKTLPVGTIVGYIGVSTDWDNETSPWLLCDGTAFARTEYTDLFLAIGTAFGNNDSTDFKVPDLRGRFVYQCTLFTSQYEDLAVPISSYGSNINESQAQHTHNLSSPITVAPGIPQRPNNNGPTLRQEDNEDAVIEFGPAPGTQLVPANASVLWLIKSS